MTFQHPSFRFLSGAVLAGALSVVALTGCKPPAEQASTGNTAIAEDTASDVQPAKPYEGDDLVIGHYGSLTGTTATFGISTDNAIKMAFEEINAKGGVLHKKLVLVSEDDGSKTEQVPSVVQKLINQRNVLALMGEVASSRSLAAAPIAQKAKVPMISPSSTNPKVTQVGDYIFRTCFIDPFQGTVMAKFAKNNLRATKAAILTDVANDYSKGLTEYFKDEWTKSGGEIVAEESYSEGDTDFQAQLTNIKAANPDVIYVPGYYTEVGSIAVQARRLGVNQVMMGGDGWDSPKLFEIGKSAVQGCYFSNHYSAQSKDPKVVKFVSAYKKEYGEVPDALAAVAYDAAYILADAIKRSGGTDRAKLRDAIAATKNFPGVTGNITIDKDRNAIKPAVVLKVVGNEGKYVTTVNP
jgi:branched-chain amino acid transport system substrate-binding protein